MESGSLAARLSGAHWRLWALLRRDGVRVNRKAVYRVLQRRGWFVHQRAATPRPRAQAQHCVGARRARAAGAEQHNAREMRAGERTPKAPAPARAVGVVADEALAFAHHAIHCADRARLLRERVQQRQHSLFARIGHVQTGEAHDAHRAHQLG